MPSFVVVHWASTGPVVIPFASHAAALRYLGDAGWVCSAVLVCCETGETWRRPD